MLGACLTQCDKAPERALHLTGEEEGHLSVYINRLLPQRRLGLVWLGFSYIMSTLRISFYQMSLAFSSIDVNLIFSGQTISLQVNFFISRPVKLWKKLHAKIHSRMSECCICLFLSHAHQIQKSNVLPWVI